MADLKSYSTAGNSPIVTINMLNKLFPAQQISNWNNKMNKYESTITENEAFNTLFNNQNENGLYNVSGCSPNSSMYNYGSLLSLNSGSFGFQIYAPEKDLGSSTTPAMYFRTRVNNVTRDWQRIATYNYVDSRINTRLPLTGGTMTGVLKSNSDIRTTSKAFLGIKATNQTVDTAPNITLALGDHDTGFNWYQDGQFHIYSNGISIAHITQNGINMIKNFTMNGNTVWNASNFNPNTVIKKSTQLSEKTDLNTINTEGVYRVKSAVNVPSSIAQWIYLEVTRHDDNWILQRIWNYEGTQAYYRTKSNGTWTRWIPTGSTFHKSIYLKKENWTKDDTEGSETRGMYYYKWNHAAYSNNIVAVSLIDTGNSSIAISYDINTADVITIWSNQPTDGTVRMLGYI